MYYLQYRHVIPVPVDRTAASAWLYTYPWITSQTNRPSTSLAHVACKLKLHSVVRPSMHPCQKNWVPIGRAGKYQDRAAQAFNVGIKCRHCTSRCLCGVSGIIQMNILYVRIESSLTTYETPLLLYPGKMYRQLCLIRTNVDPKFLSGLGKIRIMHI